MEVLTQPQVSTKQPTPAYNVLCPVVDSSSLANSASQLPDSYLLSCPYIICASLIKSINSCKQETIYDKIVNYSVKELDRFASQSVDHYAYLSRVANSCVEEFEIRFGYTHPLARMVEYLDFNEPALMEADNRSIICMPSPVINDRHWQIDYDNTSKELSAERWRIFLRSNMAHTIRFTGRPVPAYLKGIRLAPIQEEQSKDIFTYWINFISKHS